MEQQLPDCWLCLPRLSNQNTLIDSCKFGNLQLRVQISSETQSPAIRFCKQNKGKVEGIFCAVNGSLLHDKLQTGINGVVNGNGALLASQNLADINFSVQPSLETRLSALQSWNPKLASRSSFTQASGPHHPSTKVLNHLRWAEGAAEHSERRAVVKATLLIRY